MKTAKVVYFTLCFALMCVFFYFFCNGYSHRVDNSRVGGSRWQMYKNLVAYRSRKVIDLRHCDKPPEVLEENLLIGNSIWQTLSESRVFLYNAVVDTRMARSRNVTYVRLLGMSEGVLASSSLLYCQLWYRNNSAVVVEAQHTDIWVGSWDSAQPNEYYRPYLFSCLVTYPEHSLPKAVSVVQSPCQSPNNLFRFAQVPEQTTKRNFVVCLKPMAFAEDVSLRFVEWAELQFLLGADKISVYVYDVHPNVDKVLDHYEKMGKLSKKRHSLPGRDPNDPTIRDKFLKKSVWQKRRHEIIPYNDCLMEHLYTHRFLVILDMDEAIVPTMHDDWQELLDDVFADQSKALHTYASLSAANVYFFDDFGEDSDSGTIPPYMHMLRHVYRSANFSAPGLAVKSFHSVNNTLAVFNHYTLIPLYPELRRNALLSQHLARLHHYRDTCPPKMDRECETNFMKFRQRDELLWRFKEKLMRNVELTVKQLSL